MLSTHATAEKLEFAAVSMHTSRLGGRLASHSFGGAHFLRKPVNIGSHTGSLLEYPSFLERNNSSLPFLLGHQKLTCSYGHSEITRMGGEEGWRRNGVTT